MTRLLLTGAAALGMMTGVATAQTTTSQTTIVATPLPVQAPLVGAPLVAPPLGTLSTTTTKRSVDAYGTQTDSTATTYRNPNGVADDSVTRTTTFPPPVAITTTETTTTRTQ